MARGGARQGSGNKKGYKDKLTAIKELAISTGEMPHEFLLRVARGEYIQHGEELILPDFKVRCRAAEQVAAYYAPRLAQIEQKVESTQNHVISGEPLTQGQFEQKYAIDSVGSTAATEDIAGLPL
jgi:hypothetical protein